jgi:hypothetical protein
VISHAEDEWAAFRAWLTAHGRTPDTAVLYARYARKAIEHGARTPDEVAICIVGGSTDCLKKSRQGLRAYCEFREASA